MKFYVARPVYNLATLLLQTELKNRRSLKSAAQVSRMLSEESYEIFGARAQGAIS